MSDIGEKLMNLRTKRKLTVNQVCRSAFPHPGWLKSKEVFDGRRPVKLNGLKAFMKLNQEHLLPLQKYKKINIDCFVKSPNPVTPAKAGVQKLCK
jgi:hypothetical protein